MSETLKFFLCEIFEVRIFKGFVNEPEIRLKVYWTWIQCEKTSFCNLGNLTERKVQIDNLLLIESEE